MLDTPDLAPVAALLGAPTRARMLTALMDGRARTATELALDGDVAASTASSHLGRLVGAGLITIERHGRHRYFRLASPEVGAAIEGLMALAAGRGHRATGTGPREPELRRARVCYDHLAGERGVRLLVRLREERLIGGGDDAPVLSHRGQAWCAAAGIDLGALRLTRRRLCRTCLDWSERRRHLAGALGAALLDRLLVLRYARRLAHSRAIVLSPRGESLVELAGDFAPRDL